MQAEGRKDFGPDHFQAEIEKRFDELLSSNGPALLRLARSYTNSTSDRDDLFQDIALLYGRPCRDFAMKVRSERLSSESRSIARSRFLPNGGGPPQ